MMQSFRNEFNRWRYSIKADPRGKIFVIWLFFLMVAAISWPSWPLLYIVFSLLSLVYCLLFFAAEITGRKRLTPCFIIISFRGKSCVNQACTYRQIKKLKREGQTCEGMLSNEKARLIDALPPGSFAAVTHEFLIVRLLGDDSIVLTDCTVAYEHNLHSIQDKMYGCKKCNKRRRAECEMRKKGNRVRQFYYIKFEKREGQPNV